MPETLHGICLSGIEWYPDPPSASGGKGRLSVAGASHTQGHGSSVAGASHTLAHGGGFQTVGEVVWDSELEAMDLEPMEGLSDPESEGDGCNEEAGSEGESWPKDASTRRGGKRCYSPCFDFENFYIIEVIIEFENISSNLQQALRDRARRRSGTSSTKSVRATRSTASISAHRASAGMTST